MSNNEYRYQAELPANISPFKELLQEYSHIPAKEIEAHIHNIRDKAFAIAPYPGFGLWGFTRIGMFASDPNYHLATSRLTATDTGMHDKLLDIGCGLGQNLRQLVHAGVAPSRLLAVDLRWELLDLGFELFRDRERMEGGGATFLAGDVLQRDHDDNGGGCKAGLRELHGVASIIHAANLFHLFSWEKQVVAGIRVAKLLRSDAENAFIFGRQVGSLKAGARTPSTRSEESFLHDEATFQTLWDEVGQATGTTWKVKMEMLGAMPPGYEYLGEGARYCKFAIWRGQI